MAIALLLPQFAAAASWATNGVLNSPRYGHTATLLQNGQILVAGGYATDGANVTSVELYNPATGSNTLTGSLITPRSDHTATLLPNGKVLVAGGIDGYSVLSAAELYDPASETWTNTGSLNVGRCYHTATLLQNGKVLVAGGEDADFSASDTAELYDPGTGKWTLTPLMTTNRVHASATLLTNGEVLVAGGQEGGGFDPTIYFSSAELYNSTSNTWRPTGSMFVAHEDHTATLLPLGPFANQVLVAGGYNSAGVVSETELYNPNSGTWDLAGNLNTSRMNHTATLLPAGAVLVSGGTSADGATNTTEVFSITSKDWTTSGTMNFARSGQTITMLPGGKVVAIGGTDAENDAVAAVETFYQDGANWTSIGLTNITIEQQALLPNGNVLLLAYTSENYLTILYDVSKNSLSDTVQPNLPGLFNATTLLPNGKILFAGGQSATNYNGVPSAELFDPALGTFTNTGAMPSGLLASTLTLLQNGQVLIAGGFTNLQTFGVSSNCFLYNPVTQIWSQTGNLETPRALNTATLLPDGRVLVAGGIDGANELDSVELYNPATGKWTWGPYSMREYRQGHTATLLPNGKVLIAGGLNQDGSLSLSDAELFDPNTGTLTPTGSMNSDRAFHTATLLPNGMVLVTGGVVPGVSIFGNPILVDNNGAEFYDPASGRWTGTASMFEGGDTDHATLLPDGRVLVAGNGLAWVGAPIQDIEVFDTGLNDSVPRKPAISSTASTLDLGGSLAVNGFLFRDLSEGSGGNGAQDSPSDFPLVQLHSLANEQTVFLTSTGWSPNSFVSAPVTNFPPGWAMATVFVNGIQSSSSMVLIAPTPTAIILTDPLHLPDGSFQFSFTNTPGAVFTTLGTTNISTPVWNVLGGVTEVAPGQFRFDDPSASGYLQRFYRVQSP
ncbi:MAG TPA: kelch repeat-containing protein [Verrucomicrobiae bacterium]